MTESILDEAEYQPIRNADGTFLPGHNIGRPPLPEGERLVTLTARVTPAQKEWLMDEGISEAIRRLIENAMLPSQPHHMFCECDVCCPES